MSKRLLIVEEALKNRHGHWYEYNRAIIEEARRQGIDTTILAHRDLDADLQKEMKAEPYFAVTCWDQVYYHRSKWRRYLGILQHNLHVARRMQRHFASQPPYDVVLVPTVVLYHWLAWRWLAWRCGGRSFRKLVLTTRNNAGEFDPITRGYQFKSSAKVLRRALESFGPLVKSGLVEMATDSSRLASQYTNLCGVPFLTYPHPRSSEHLPINRRVRDLQESLVFSALGPPRYEKGSDLILDAICLVRRRRPDLNVRFVLQWTGRVYDVDKHEAVPPAELETDRQVEFIRRDLTSSEYQRQLDTTDVLLVPYRRSQYYARLSGIAIEAFQSGIPCICVSNTWVADSMATIGAGIAIGDETAPALADAIIAIAARWSDYGELAKERALLARRTHSAATFVNILFSLQN